MMMFAIWVIGFINGVTITLGYTDLTSCEEKRSNNADSIENVYCMVTRDDVSLLCPRGTTIVLSSLQFAVKESVDFCKRRVLSSSDRFCCSAQDSDIVYNSDCLYNMWYKDDKHQYRTFLKQTLQKCGNTSSCVIRSKMLRHLKRRLPGSRTYSSYLRIIHQCIPAPSDPVRLCSSKSVTAAQLHITQTFDSLEHTNATCRCLVTSQGDDKVTVRAVDVRASFSLKSEDLFKNISSDHLPLFGFTELFVDKEIVISSQSDNIYADDNLWLHITGTGDNKVNIVCNEHDDEPVSSSRDTLIPEKSTHRVGKVFSGNEEPENEGYWPIIYLAAGSFITLAPIVCLSCCCLLAKTSSNERKKYPQDHDKRYFQTRSDFNKCQNGVPYSTVLDDIPSRPTSRLSSQQGTGARSKARERKSETRNSDHRLPAPPKPSIEAEKVSVHMDTRLPEPLPITQATPYDVTELVPFPVNRRTSHSSTMSPTLERSESELVVSDPRFDSGFSETFNQNIQSSVKSDSRPDTSPSPSYFVLEKEGTIV